MEDIIIPILQVKQLGYKEADNWSKSLGEQVTN